jgi:uncharacterized protein (TIGR04255 family)
MKKLPKKITPDRIRDAIVQVFFSTDIPFNPLVGYLYSVFDELGYMYTNRLPSATERGGTEISIHLTPQHFFFNEHIKIQLLANNSLVFNCMNHYLGWNQYQPLIAGVLKVLCEKEIVLVFNQIGVRYISEFPDISLQGNLRFSFRTEGIPGKLQNATYRTEWLHGQHKIMVSLGDKLPVRAVVVEPQQTADFVSLIDIDIISYPADNSDRGSPSVAETDFL